MLLLINTLLLSTLLLLTIPLFLLFYSKLIQLALYLQTTYDLGSKRGVEGGNSVQKSTTVKEVKVMTYDFTKVAKANEERKKKLAEERIQSNDAVRKSYRLNQPKGTAAPTKPNPNRPHWLVSKKETANDE